MDLRRIRHFVVLAETLNFRKAAERLHMSQPPLSVSIQKLEVELGTKLFVRTSNGVVLTSGGQTALIEAKRLLFHGNQLLHAARSATDGTGGSLHVGFIESVTHGMLQKLIPIYRAEYPGVELILHGGTSPRIIRRIENDELDVGLIRTPLMLTSNVTIVPLVKDEFMVALPQANPLSKVALLELSDLADESFVMYSVGDGSALRSCAMLACQQAGFVPKISQEALQIQTLLALVDSGLGVALIPSVMRRFLNDRIAYRTLTNPPSAASIGIALAYRKERESASALKFRTLVTKEFPMNLE